MKWITTLLIVLSVSYLWGQTETKNYKDSLSKSIVEQVVLFPQEKIHLQNDKPIYVSGEKIWFRAYLVDAVLHKPINTSSYVYVELINPLDSTTNRLRIKQNDDAFCGYIPLAENLPEGDYTICAYTQNMKNMGADYFFRKHVHIINPLSIIFRTEASFISNSDGKMSAEIHFPDIQKQGKIKIEDLKIKVNNQLQNMVKKNDNESVLVPIKLSESSKGRILSIEFPKYKKYIQIPNATNDFEVSFYPEGGYMPEGATSIVAFKALRVDGFSEIITGRIIDNTGTEYSQIQTAHDGMGTFSLLPKAGKSYFAICTNKQGIEKKFALPAARKGIYSLNVENSPDKLYVSVLCSSDKQCTDSLFLLIHTRGMIHYAAPWDPNFKKILFNPKKFPSGVMQIILLDKNRNPLSERLVYCQNQDQANIAVQPNRKNYESRQEVTATVMLTDNNKIPQEGSFSISVTDDTDIQADTTTNIQTDFLLCSELKGNISNPAFYSQKDNPEAESALDMLMLTHGWRRYNIPDIIKGKYEIPKVPQEQGMKISGTTKNLLWGKPLRKAKITIFSWDADCFEETTTDSVGHFIFDGFECPDSISFVLQAVTSKGSERTELQIDPEIFPQLSGLPPVDIPTVKTTKTEEKEQDLRQNELISYVTKADQKYTLENGMRRIFLDEIKVTAKAPEEKGQNLSYYMPKANTNTLNSKQIAEIQPASVSDIIAHLPFVRVVESDTGLKKVIIDRMQLRMSGGYNYAALIVDDTFICDYNLDDVVDPSNIEKIGVLKGASAMLLGGDGTGGAIVITTKRGRTFGNTPPNTNFKKVTPLGYQSPAEFYSPKYETKEQRNASNPDLRTTIYWNPNVKVSSTGEATISFYTADTATNYTLLIEGLTSYGKIIYGTQKILRK